MTAGITERTNDDWQQNTQPMTLAGDSGGGKTTTMRFLADSWEGGPAVTFNLDHEPNMGKIVKSVSDLQNALERGNQMIDVRPPAHVVAEPELFEDVTRYLMQLGNQLRESGDGKILFLMDEAHDLQEKWVNVALKRFRKRRIKPLAATQDPISFPKRGRTISDYNCWVSPPEGDMKDNLGKHTEYPVELLIQLPQYDMLVMDGDWNAVERIRAPEGFAHD